MGGIQQLVQSTPRIPRDKFLSEVSMAIKICEDGLISRENCPKYIKKSYALFKILSLDLIPMYLSICKYSLVIKACGNVHNLCLVFESFA